MIQVEGFEIPVMGLMLRNQINSVMISLKQRRPARLRRRWPVVNWWPSHAASKAWQKSSTWQNKATKFIVRALGWLGFRMEIPKVSQKGRPLLIPNSR